MRGVKGCFVCGKDHRANTRYTREEVTAAIDILKAKHPKALLTVEDLIEVIDMEAFSEEEEEREEGAKWIEDDDIDGGSEISYLIEEVATELEISLSHNAYAHGRTFSSDMASELVTMYKHLRGDTESNFNWIKIDTAANRRSVMSKAQYLAYASEFGRKVPIRPANKRVLKGIGGLGKVICEETIQIPFNKLNLIIDVDFAIMEETCPSLLRNRDMITNGLEISLQGGYIHVGNRQQPLQLENDFYVYRWRADDTPFALYIESDLRRIHRGFGHPSVQETHNLLRRASADTLAKNILSILQKIADDCDVCKRNGPKPRIFKLTIGNEDMCFNNRVVVDKMFIDSKPVINLVDESTHFTSACFLKNQCSSEIWKAITKLWFMTYMGPPDHLAVEQGSAYISKELKANIEASGINLEEAPIENPGSIGIVERYHAPLRRAYTKIRQTLHRGEATDAEFLQMIPGNHIM